VEDTKAFYDTLNGSFEGIGAELGIENDVLVVVAPLEGFPAQKAGLRAGDIIAKIDEHDSLHMTVEEAVSKIRGEKGTQVTLTIVRDGKEQEIKITRDTITVPSVEHEMLAGNVGRITVSRFAEDTGDLARSAANTLKKDGAKAIILDLRNNSGGYVDAGVSVASLWLDEGKTVFEQRSGGRTVETSQASGDAVLKGLPTIVLINEGSASASEIVAGALKDNGVAELLGVKSFGKGSVQRLEELSDGSTLKVTIARWFTPNGVNIDQDGIVPDVEVTISDEDIQAKRDPQLDAASKKLVQQ
jgi:carboxyl-terminal processing protease